MFEALYQAYLATILSGAAFLFASDFVGDHQVSARQLAGVRHGGAADVPGLFLMPEVAGIGMVLRETLPPAVVTIGLLPLLAARQAAQAGRGPVAAAVACDIALVVPVAATVWWLSRRRLA